MKHKIILILVFFGIIISPSFALAATIYADYSAGNDTTGDGSSGNPYKTFYKAYTMASSGDTLNLAGTFNWTNADETGDAITTGYTISKNLTLQGQSADTTIIQAASSYATGDRAVFNISAGYAVTINDLTVRYGYNRTGSNGGGINNEGTLTINRCSISYNYVWYYPSWGGYGGGIRNAGTLTVNDSAINNNFAQSQGGGIVNAYTAAGNNVVYITNSTIAFNSTADVVATVGGAGIFLRSGTAYVTNSTIAYNVAPDGTGDTTGIDVDSATLYIKNSIVVGNKVTVGGTNYNVNYASGNFFDISNSGTLHDNGGNVFGKVDTAFSGVSFAATTWYDLYGNGAGDNIFTLHNTATTGSLYLDGSLADNGTMYGNQTLAITNAASVAVNRGLVTNNGSVSIPSLDQRGASRNGLTDVGAYEYDGGLTVSAPSTQASNIAFSSVAYNQMTISWTNGNGSKRIVFIKQADTGMALPVDLTAYTANPVFGSGAQIGTSGWYAVYNDTGASITVTGLSASTNYIAQVIEYNGTSGYQKYLTDTASDNPKTQGTIALVAPTNQASGITFSSVASSQVTISWTNGNGLARAVFIKLGSSGTASPVNDATYSASTVFASGTQIGTSGWYCVYNGTGTTVTVTGLSASTSYIAQVIEYNGLAGVEKYFTDSALDNPKQQSTSAAPTEAIIGTGTSATGISEASPINIWYRSSHGQSIYTAAELNAAGITGSAQIIKIGFYVVSAPIRALPNFIIRIKHTTDATVASWQTATGMTTAYSSASYTPTAGGFDSITLTTPFTWNGTDNLVIDTAFSIVDYDQSGVVRYYSSANGFRYTRSDSSDQTNIFSGGSASSSKPQIKLTFSSSTPTYSLSYSAGANGSVTGNASQTVNSGASGSAVTAVPDTGYHFVNWSDGSTANPRTDVNVVADLSVTANFAINTYTLSYSAGAHGSITGSSSQTVNYNASGSAVTATADPTYYFTSWSDGLTANPRIDAAVTQNISVTASFAQASYTLTYAAGAHGAISGTSSQTVAEGSSGTAVTAVPDTGYHFTSWDDGVLTAARTDTSITANHTYTANFAIDTYSLSYVAGSNGSLTGSASQSVDYNANGSAVTAVPDSGYDFSSWSDGSVANPRVDTNVVSNISVTANFTAQITTVYVNSSTGNDSTGDGTSGNPYKTFHKGYVSTASGSTLDLTGTFTLTDTSETGDAIITGYTISKNITISGHGADTTIIQAANYDNVANRRVFTIASGATVAINSLAIRYGKLTDSTNDGGGIKNSGITTITDCEIYNNRAIGTYGGGISNWNKLTLNRSAVYNNTANYMGGGLVNSYYVASDGFLNITNSTIAYNQITAVTAYTEGGGVHYRKGSGTITNSTIAYNMACGAGGVGMDDLNGVLTIKNSIIAKNIRLNHAYCHNGLAPIDFDFRQAGYGNVVDNGNNIIGYSYRYSWAGANEWIGATTWGGALNWNGNTFTLRGIGTTGSLNLDASLALNDNANKTQTLALSSGSIAINHGAVGDNGTVGVPTTDQRGNSRVGNTDIGAFEFSGGPADTTAPIISNILATVTSSTATITWATNEESSSQIKYDPSTYLSTRTPIYNSSIKTIGHEVEVSNLVACSKYYYAVISQDDAGNVAVSGTNYFITSGCAGSAEIRAINELVFTPAAVNGAEVDTATSVASDSDHSVSQSSGGLTFGLTIPRAFSETVTNLQVKGLAAASALSSLNKPNNYNAVGTSVFDVKALTDPTSTINSFTSSITVTLTYTASDVAGIDESTLGIYRNDGASWSRLTNCVVNQTAKTVTCSTIRFSVFGLFGQTQTTGGGGSSSGGSSSGDSGGGSGGVSYYIIRASAGINGSINPDGLTSVNNKGSQTYIITPSVGYQIADVLVDGVSKGPLAIYTFTNVTSTHTISATFLPMNTPATTSVPPKTDFSDIESIKKEIQRIQDLIRELSLQKAGIAATNEYIFTRNLYAGIRGQDVRELQRYLNNNGFKIASSGDGSKGNETEFFGQLTKNALIKFQNANKIYPSTGFFGPITRSFILKNKQ